ncbi:MAG: hypothetical protein ABI855_05200 [Bacteroidota bacterium]
MKTKNAILKTALVLALTGLIFSGCRKNNSFDESSAADELSQQITNGSDESRFSAASDNVLDESNNVALDNSRFRGAGFHGIWLLSHTPCNATIDSSQASIGKLTVTFNGTSCDGERTRTGQIVLQLPYNGTSVTPFSEAGCMLTITFNDFKISRLNENKTLTFNGTKYVTNVNGGLVDDASEISTPIVHHITGLVQITFDDGTVRTWNIDRNRSITRLNNVTTVTITGNATENGYSQVSIWGISRKGDSFTVTINTPVVLSSGCDYNAMSGVRMLHHVIRELTATYGVDQNGNAVTSGCPYGFKLNWMDKQGNAMQKVIAY